MQSTQHRIVVVAVEGRRRRASRRCVRRDAGANCCNCYAVRRDAAGDVVDKRCFLQQLAAVPSSLTILYNTTPSSDD